MNFDEKDPANWACFYRVHGPIQERHIEKERKRIASLKGKKAVPPEKIEEAAIRAAKAKGGDPMGKVLEDPNFAKEYLKLAGPGAVLITTYKQRVGLNRWRASEAPPRNVLAAAGFVDRPTPSQKPKGEPRCQLTAHSA